MAELTQLADGELAAEPGRPVELLGNAWWPPSLMKGDRAAAPAEPGTLSALAAVAADSLRLHFPHDEDLAFEARLIEAYDEDPNDRRTLTWLITEGLRSWAYRQGWQPFRELRVPVSDERVAGRLDLVCFRPGLPDLVVEIDSSSSDRSRAKLELVRDGGALTVWVRWRDGLASPLPGVHVIDLTTRRATRPRVVA